jgi:hypothetical protein
MRVLGNAAQREWATNELDGHARSDALEATAVFDMAGVQGAIRFSQLGAVTTVRVATCASVCAGAFLERRCQRNSLKVSVVRMAAGAPAGRSVGNPTAGVGNENVVDARNPWPACSYQAPPAFTPPRNKHTHTRAHPPTQAGPLSDPVIQTVLDQIALTMPHDARMASVRAGTWGHV